MSLISLRYGRVLSKVKNFVKKYWQWLVLGLTSLAFYLLGRSKDTKIEEVKLANISKVLEEEKTQEILKGWLEAEEEKSASLAENLLIFEENKAKILEEAGNIDIEEYLKSKGISRDED